MRVTIVSEQMLPIGDNFSCPSASRIWGIGEGIRQSGIEVTYLISEEVYNHKFDNEKHKKINFYTDLNINDLLKEINPDCVIAQNWQVAEKINRKQLPMIIDLSLSPITDNSYSLGVSDQIRKINALKKGDMFICASEKQKWFYMSWLIQSGFDLSADLIKVVPHYFPKTLLNQNKNYEGKDNSLMFASYWDSNKNIDIDLAGKISDKLSLKNSSAYQFLSGSDSYQSGLENYIALSENSQHISENLIINEVFSWGEMINELRLADVGICLSKKTLEGELSFPVEAALYMLSGLPVVCNKGTDIGNLVEKYDAGWTVNVGDSDKVADFIYKITENHDDVADKSKNALKLAREIFQDHQYIHPIIDFCRRNTKVYPQNEGLAGYLINYSNKVLNMSNPLLNDIYIENILILHSGSWDHLVQCLDAIDIMFPLSDITILSPRCQNIEDFDMISDCNLIVSDFDSFDPDLFKEALMVSDSSRFDLAIALFNNHYGEENVELKQSLTGCGAKYKVGFTLDQNFVMVEDSIEKCILDVFEELNEAQYNPSSITSKK